LGTQRIGAFAYWVRAQTEPYSMFRVSASVASLIARDFHAGVGCV
jgi:hypothetical protein